MCGTSNCVFISQLVILIFLFLFCKNNVQADYGIYFGVDEFISMVVSNITASKEYVLPPDNSMLINVSSKSLNDYGQFDFIIVGSGGAGAVLANRLSEIPEFNVLLLEAGGEVNDFTDILGMYSYFMNSNANWGYSTTPQKNAGSISWLYPRGKAIGGSTSINGAVYARGHHEDFDNWRQPAWTYEDILPYFKKSENVRFSDHDVKYHGTEGPMHVDTSSDTPGLSSIVLNAFKELGQPELSDYNGKNQLGIGKAQYNLNWNRRDSTATAFLNSIRKRENFNLSLNSFVTKLLIDKEKKAAYGVEFVKDGKRYKATVTKEVILSAGAINSPQILMLSGIGCKKHLDDMGIDVVSDLPVGDNVIEHVYFNTTKYKTTNLTFYNVTFREQAEFFLANKRPLTAMSDYLSFVKLSNLNDHERPDIELEIDTVAPAYEDYLNSDNQLQNYTISNGNLHHILVTVILLHPKARGTIRLRSNNPADFPVIDPNILGNEEDIETVYQGLLYTLKLNNTKTFMENFISFDYPDVEACDADHERYAKDWWYCAIRLGSTVGGHIAGSTPMGNSSKTSVVDSSLKVHGMTGLRVVDAGIMPDTVSGHPAAATMMIGEKAADIIKEDYEIICLLSS